MCPPMVLPREGDYPASRCPLRAMADNDTMLFPFDRLAPVVAVTRTSIGAGNNCNRLRRHALRMYRVCERQSPNLSPLDVIGTEELGTGRQLQYPAVLLDLAEAAGGESIDCAHDLGSAKECVLSHRSSWEQIENGG